MRNQDIRTGLIAFLLMLLVGSTAWADTEACVVCSVNQGVIHLEDCPLKERVGTETFYFCKRGCRDEFLSDPESWSRKFAALKTDTTQAEAGSLPDFRFPLEPIGSLSRADLEGKVVVINMWATWCAPCMAEMPDLIKLQEQLSNEGLAVLALSFDKTSEAHRKGIKDLGLNFVSIEANKPEVQSFLKQIGPPESIPVTLIVDREFKIVKRFNRPVDYQMLKDVVSPLLKKDGDEVSRADQGGSIVPS